MNDTDDWYDVTELAPGTWRINEGGIFRNYLVAGEDRALVIDAGAGIGDLRGMAEQLVDVPVTLLLTHAHWDHVGAGHRFDDVIAHPLAHEGGHIPIEPFVLTPQDWASEWLEAGNELPDRVAPETIDIPPVDGVESVYPGTVLDLGDRDVELIATPGHAAEQLGVIDRKTGSAFLSDVVHMEYDLYGHLPGNDLRDYQGTMALLADLFAAGTFETVHSAHVPPLAGEACALLADYRDALAAILAGDREGEFVDDPLSPYVEYDAAGNAIRTPA